MADESTTQSTSVDVASTPATPPQEPPPFFKHLPPMPTMDAIDGIRFDFNYGFRLTVPENCKTTYVVVVTDEDRHVVLFSAPIDPGKGVFTHQKYYIRYKLQIFKQGEKEPCFEHVMDLSDRPVMVFANSPGLGDTIAWFSYCERFQKKHNCKLTVVMHKPYIELFAPQYPDIKFITDQDLAGRDTYARYLCGVFYGGNTENQPVDFKYTGLHTTVGNILGLEGDELKDEPPRVKLNSKRSIKEKYVCIGAKASAQTKYWNNPQGWPEVVKWLKDKGYRVLCIDKEKCHGQDVVWNYIPYGAEDFTGDLPLQERIDLLRHADFFIGLSSGLSWLAWCCKIPVVLISGFTEPWTEFYTPYRVQNTHLCHGCWNDQRTDMDLKQFLWCPRHSEDGRRFECTKGISPEYVIDVIKKIPGVE